MKELVINGKVYAKYEINGKFLYIKMLIKIIKGNVSESENLLIHIIECIENVNIKAVGYLNVK